MSRALVDEGRPLCQHNSGVWCGRTYCLEHCGWRPDEEERRKRRIRRGAFNRNKQGLKSLLVNRKDARFVNW